MKSFFWIAIATAAIIGIMFWSVKGGAGIEPPLKTDALHPQDNVKGNPNGILVMEYSDFQCSACRTYYFVLKELAVEYGDDVAFVYRHFPLNEIHINAELAARAAEAAGKQGKFWEMHDMLFEKQSEWATNSDPRALFESYARLIGISADQFKADSASKEIKDLVRAHRAHSIGLGLQGTPTFFINGKQIKNPGSVDEFRAQIKDALRGE